MVNWGVFNSTIGYNNSGVGMNNLLFLLRKNGNKYNNDLNIQRYKVCTHALNTKKKGNNL